MYKDLRKERVEIFGETIGKGNIFTCPFHLQKIYAEI